MKKGWGKVRLEDLFEVKYGRGLPDRLRNGAGAVPVYGSNGVVGRHDEALTAGPTILIGRKGSAGEVHVSTGPCWPIDTTYFIDELPAEFPIRYWALYFRSLGLMRQDKSSTIPSLRREDLYDNVVPVPPLAEQNRIIAKLDEILGAVDASQKRLEKAPAILKRFRQSVLAAACSGRLTESWHGHSDFTQDTFEGVAKWSSGGTPSRSHPEYYGGAIPWVKTGELRENLITDTGEKLTKAGLENSSAKIFPKGAILVAMYGATIGRVAELGIDATTNQACACGVVYPDRMIGRYLYYLLMAEKQALIAKGQGGAQPNISQGLIKEHEILVPSLTEQKEIVRRIEGLFTLADQIKARYDTIEESVDQLTQSILAKAFRGELVAQDPKDEPASVLLDRIGVERGGREKQGQRKMAVKA